MDKTLLPLYNQFCNANGLEIPRIDRIEVHQGFYDWIREMQSIVGPRYLDTLDYLGLELYNSSETAEVGKGAYDSLVISDEYETKMISPPKIAKNIRGLGKLMLTGFVVNDGVPYLADNGVPYALKYGDPFCSFMTQNPYRPVDIIGWSGIHNLNGFGVIVGAFGRIQDADRQAKVELIKDFYVRLSDSSVGDYLEEGAYYFCVAGSKPMTLRREFRGPRFGR